MAFIEKGVAPASNAPLRLQSAHAIELCARPVYRAKGHCPQGQLYCDSVRDMLPNESQAVAAMRMINAERRPTKGRSKFEPPHSLTAVHSDGRRGATL